MGLKYLKNQCIHWLSSDNVSRIRIFILRYAYSQFIKHPLLYITIYSPSYKYKCCVFLIRYLTALIIRIVSQCKWSMGISELKLVKRWYQIVNLNILSKM